MPGRWLCPTCKGKPYSRYHFHWELTPIDVFVDTDSRDVRINLIDIRIDDSVIFSNLCPSCMISLMAKIDTSVSDELESIQIDYRLPDVSRV